MDLSQRLSLSYYKTIATINETHHVYLVQHQENKQIYIKKISDVYNLPIYEYLQSHNITGIPQIYDIYEENNQLTIIEEYISGTSLQELMDNHAVSVDLIVHYMCELCDILERLHFLNPPIIHRDIKPSNVIITPNDHVVLIDFNAAKYLKEHADSDTVLLGTKGYAAPEQYGFGSSTPQTDIYALGILLKELVSALPFSTNLFDSVINKCTQMNPSDRMKNVHKLKAAIEKLQIPSAVEPQFNEQQSFQSPLLESHPAKPVTWKDLIPPGFRTETPWKMMIASPVYAFIFWLCLSLKIEYGTVADLWIDRIGCLLIMLSVVFSCFNYCNIQRLIPLCRDRRRIVRYLGILFLNVVLIFWLLIAMFILINIF